jgi:inner membrane protein
MMTRTHGITGIAVWMTGDTVAHACGLGHPYSVTFAGAIIAWVAAKVPDIDNPDSHPGRQVNALVPGLSTAIGAAFGHRGLTHWAITGLLGGAIAGILAGLASPSLWWVGLAVAVGWVTHIAGDCCTYRGAPAFGPFRRGVVRIPYGYRIECGGPVEIRFVYPAALAWALSMYTASLALAVFA